MLIREHMFGLLASVRGKLEAHLAHSLHTLSGLRLLLALLDLLLTVLLVELLSSPLTLLLEPLDNIDCAARVKVEGALMLASIAVVIVLFCAEVVQSDSGRNARK